MKILFVSSECAPFSKSGGLADVAFSLPPALQKTGDDMAIVTPMYRVTQENYGDEFERIKTCQIVLGQRRLACSLYRGALNGVTVYAIGNEHLFHRPRLYGYGDDSLRFAFFCRAVIDLLPEFGDLPDILHCNDWETALAILYLKNDAVLRPELSHIKTVYTIHNIEYQGWANAGFFDDVLGLPWEYRSTLDMSNSVNVMKGAIETADLVTTVSETYARELMYPYYAHGLDSVLAGNAWKLTGITNGIDVNTFNPETDPALPAHYNAETFVEGKAAVKAALQKEVGLPVKPDVPLMVMVTRLASHKGLDLLCYIARRLMWEEDAQLLILGTGEAQYESFFRDLSNQFPDQVSAQITFNLGLAARIYAGGDIYLMPSKSEPCGLSQMNAMRYGTVPVVHATGGLKDTVPPADENGEGGLGFTFQSYNADDFFASLKRCLGLYNHNREAFRALQKRDMEKDFSWDVPAGRYMEQFRNMLSW